ncbi:hypothetical protein AGLY_010897 [Aphis glycines]|uniref:Uncharacterized protein n=1 Tax=Aphis glycines TaxID=307491 RepID=A0A6G0TFS1_APHGL|nr:hypothetical protein AGLY_010897 [Aphis glycines]
MGVQGWRLQLATVTNTYNLYFLYLLELRKNLKNYYRIHIANYRMHISINYFYILFFGSANIEMFIPFPTYQHCYIYFVVNLIPNETINWISHTSRALNKDNHTRRQTINRASRLKLYILHCKGLDFLKSSCTSPLSRTGHALAPKAVHKSPTRPQQLFNIPGCALGSEQIEIIYRTMNGNKHLDWEYILHLSVLVQYQYKQPTHLHEVHLSIQQFLHHWDPTEVVLLELKHLKHDLGTF